MSRLLSLKRVAEMLDVSPKTVRRWIADGQFPGPTHTLPGGNIRWEERVVEGWKAIHATAFQPFFPTHVKGKSRGPNRDNAGQGRPNVGAGASN